MSLANEEVDHGGDIANGSGYEPWLFQSMLDELSINELGIGFVYSVMETLAKRYSLRDVIVNLSHESFGEQMFRLGGQAVSAEMAANIGTSPGVYCDPDVVPPEELGAVRTACQLALSLHLARFSAAHDPLTNIANRRTFDSALEAAAARSARYGWAFTLLVIDLNGFKNINDTLGHAIGDDLLRQFGVAMRRSVRSGDVAARIGGDEFAVILSNADGFEATGFVDRLRCNLKAASELLEFSVGTSTSPRDSTDPTELFRVADARLYEKKGLTH
jgi:diguanylate cyclase (GGDEF)-like protein